MNMTLIYKETHDVNGNVLKIDPVEWDESDANAQKFTKLYQLQLPADLKNTTTFKSFRIKS